MRDEQRRPDQQEEQEEEEITKGIISIQRMPTACHACGDILVNTYVDRNDIMTNRTDVYVLCGRCVEVLPVAIKERIKYNPATPRMPR